MAQVRFCVCVSIGRYQGFAAWGQKRRVAQLWHRQTEQYRTNLNSCVTENVTFSRNKAERKMPEKRELSLFRALSFEKSVEAPPGFGPGNRGFAVLYSISVLLRGARVSGFLELCWHSFWHKRRCSVTQCSVTERNIGEQRRRLSAGFVTEAKHRYGL